MSPVLKNFRRNFNVDDGKDLLLTPLWRYIDYRANLRLPPYAKLPNLVFFLLNYVKDKEEIYPYLCSDESGYFYDNHVHSNYSDGHDSPEEIATYLSKTRYKDRLFLDGISLTDHSLLNSNARFQSNDRCIDSSYHFVAKVKELKKKGKLPDHFISFPGVEFNVGHREKGDRFDREILGLGIAKDFINRLGGTEKIAFMQPVELIEAIHDEGGIAILPHPFGPSGCQLTTDDADASIEAWKKADGIETINLATGVIFDDLFIRNALKMPHSALFDKLLILMGYFNWMIDKTARKWHLPAVANSDAHDMKLIGAG
ncbi:MAG: PHP domain-containing protein, partial [Candidatus Helarchaeales archaeon]